MTDLFKLQTDAGRLWPDIADALNEQSTKAQTDIAAALAAKDAELVGLRDSSAAELASQKAAADSALSDALANAAAELAAAKVAADAAEADANSTAAAAHAAFDVALAEAHDATSAAQNERSDAFAARDTALAQLAASATLLATAKKLYVDGNHDGLANLIAEEEKTANEKRRDVLLKQKAAIDAELGGLGAPQN